MAKQPDPPPGAQGAPLHHKLLDGGKRPTELLDGATAVVPQPVPADRACREPKARSAPHGQALEGSTGFRSHDCAQEVLEGIADRIPEALVFASGASPVRTARTPSHKHTKGIPEN